MPSEPGEFDKAGVRASVRNTASESLAFIDQLTDDLLLQGSLLTVAIVISSACNYAFQLFMGRTLGPSEYGVFGALFALFYLITVLGSGIRFSASRFVAELNESGQHVAAFYRGLFRRSLLLGVGVCCLVVLMSSVISRFLQLPSVVPVLAVAVTIPLVFLVMANMGVFQGLELFGLFGSYRILDAVVKLLAGIVLVGFGYGVFGAFGALIIAAATAVAVTTFHARRCLPASTAPPGPHQFDYTRLYTYVPSAVLAGFCLTVPANVDVIIVRHFFSGEQTGLYTAASVLGKVLIFLPMGVSTALFPKVTSDQASGDVEAMFARLRRALLYTAVTAGTSALVFWLRPKVILRLLFGSSYTDAAPLVRWYGIAIFVFVLATVVLNFELARDRTQFVYVFTGITVAEIGLMWTFHGSMVQIIHVLLVVNVGLLIYGLIEVRR